MESTADLLDRLRRLYPNDEDVAPVDTNFPRWTDHDDTFAPFIPTSVNKVVEALALARCGPDDHVIDLGMGDGRVCVIAVALFGAAVATGIESDQSTYALACDLLTQATSANILTAAAAARILFERCDFRTFTPRSNNRVSVVFAFLAPEFASECSEKIRAYYDSGARIVSLVFDLNELGLELSATATDGGIWVYERLK
ncbi:hypothetical protein HDU84_006782 [Entophlyctis sp. JEL0112]|nr:hypothetical protein HDU84_006782 [Entophlyctis sp. JEL0112]